MFKLILILYNQQNLKTKSMILLKNVMILKKKFLKQNLKLFHILILTKIF